jgi:hypothetical protein
VGVADPFLPHPLAHPVEHRLRRLEAGVGAEQDLLELEPEVLVDAAAVEDAGDAAEPAAAGTAERLLRLGLDLLRPLFELGLNLRLRLEDGGLALDGWFGFFVTAAAKEEGQAGTPSSA